MLSQRYSVGKAWYNLVYQVKEAQLLLGELPMSPKLLGLIECWWLLMQFSDNFTQDRRVTLEQNSMALRLCIIHVSWSAYLNAKVRTNIFIHVNIQILRCLYCFICTILSESKSINPIESLLEKRKKCGKIWAITDVYFVACTFKLEN